MDKYTYAEAFEELQVIVGEIESASIDIDTLSEKIKRASALLEICKAKLTATETEVSSLLEKLAPPTEDA